MSDILIRDVAEATVNEVEQRAKHQGLSRNEYLKRWLDHEMRPEDSVTVQDLDRFSELARDLDAPDVMRQAWS